MRLLNVRNFSLKEFYGTNIPPYAILSHTWEEEEVSFNDWQNIHVAATKSGFAKIQDACYQAQVDGHEWLWVDTNCIDKTSSAELSEAINSMFVWYARSETCYAYLSDVTPARSRRVIHSQFRESRWFSRGWTLQELLAPKSVVFYAKDWSRIGSRGRSMRREITLATGIDEEYLMGGALIKRASIAKKMSWISTRTTTRTEDIAYCMLGIVDINMPLLYGEGSKAFTRLQEEIIKISNDHTIFCWHWNRAVPKEWTSLLAPSPEVFRHCGDMVRKKGLVNLANRDVSTYHMTNAGLPTLVTISGYVIALDATFQSQHSKSGTDRGRAWIPVYGDNRNGTLLVARDPSPTRPILLDDIFYGIASQRTLVVQRTKDEEFAQRHFERGGPPMYDEITSSEFLEGRFGVYPAFQTTKLRDSWIKGCDAETDLNSAKNIMWLDSTDFRSREVRSLVVQTNIRGTGRTAADERRWDKATVWVGAVVMRKSNSLVDYGWSCRILARNERQEVRVRALKTTMEKAVLDEDLREDWVSHHELNLQVRLGGYVHGLREGRMRFLAVYRRLPAVSRTHMDEADYSDVVSMRSNDAVVA